MRHPGGRIRRQSFETRAAPDPRGGVKRPPPGIKWGGGSGAARGCTPGGASDRLAALDGRHPGLRAIEHLRSMAGLGTKEKFSGHDA